MLGVVESFGKPQTLPSFCFLAVTAFVGMFYCYLQQVQGQLQFYKLATTFYGAARYAVFQEMTDIGRRLPVRLSSNGRRSCILCHATDSYGLCTLSLHCIISRSLSSLQLKGKKRERERKTHFFPLNNRSCSEFFFAKEANKRNGKRAKVEANRQRQSNEFFSDIRK